MNNEVLREIFVRQAGLNKRCGMDPKLCISDQELTAWIQYYLAALYNESEELRSWTHFKKWKQYDKPIDRHQCKVEIIDMLHFLISLALPLMDADEFVDLYWGKLSINNHRQDVGYNQEYEEKFKQPGNEDNDTLRNDPPEVRCPACHGRGYDYGHDKNAENETCAVCKGKGQITTQKHNEIYGKKDNVCKRCGGSGIIYKTVSAQQTRGHIPVIGCHMETDMCPDCFEERVMKTFEARKDDDLCSDSKGVYNE